MTVGNASSYLTEGWDVGNISVTGGGAAKGNIALDAATGTLGYYIWTTVVDAQTADASTKSFTASDCGAATSNTLVRSGYHYYLDQSLNAAGQGEAGYGYAKGSLTVEEGAYAYVEADAGNPVGVADMAQLEKNGSNFPARITDANIGEDDDGNREFTARLENTRVLLSSDEAAVISRHLELDNAVVALAEGTSLRIDDLVVGATSSVAPASTLGAPAAISVAQTASVVLDATVDAGKATLTSTQVGILLEEGAAMTLTFTKGLLDKMDFKDGETRKITLIMEGMGYEGDTPQISLDFSQAPGYSFDEATLSISPVSGGTQIVFAASYTPEPGTTTLALLALAAMAARRRR